MLRPHNSPLKALSRIAGSRASNSAEVFEAGKIIELEDFTAIRGIGEFQTEHPGVFLRLLHTGRGTFIRSLCLDDGERKIAAVTKQIIDAFRLLAHETFAHGNNPAIGNGTLFGDGTRISVPPCRLEFRHHEFSTCIGFSSKHKRVFMGLLSETLQESSRGNYPFSLGLSQNRSQNREMALRLL